MRKNEFHLPGITFRHLLGETPEQIVAGLPQRPEHECLLAYKYIDTIIGKEAMIATISSAPSRGQSSADVLAIVEPRLKSCYDDGKNEYWPAVQELHALAVEGTVRAGRAIDAQLDQRN